jgi:hypothetical protein
MAFNQEQTDQIQQMFAGMFLEFGRAAAVAAGAGAAAPQRSPEGGGGRRRICEKSYSKVAKFDGKESGWRQWAFQFRVATTAALMEKVQGMKDVANIEDLVLGDEYQGLAEEMTEKATELYDILCLQCEGEALQVVQSITDMDGFAAWQKLHKVCNSQTIAKVMAKVMAVVAPPRVVDLRTMVRCVEDWEAKGRELKTETGEEVPEKFMMAILTTMCPPSVQDWIFQQTTEGTKYPELRDKVLSIVSNRVSLAEGPVAMDIGAIQGHGQGDWRGEAYGEPEDDLGIGAVSRDVQCHKCQGWGAFRQRLCNREGRRQRWRQRRLQGERWAVPAVRQRRRTRSWDQRQG